jgi:hypothetical protein
MKRMRLPCHITKSTCSGFVKMLWCFSIFSLAMWQSVSAVQADRISPKSFAKFTTGLIAAYALHETGHGIAAAATGTKMEWGIGTYNQPIGFTEQADTDTDGLLVHSAGLVTQVIGSEIVLRSDLNKNDAFVRGMMTWNVINPVLYAVDYWIIRRTNQEVGSYYQGDLEGFEHYSDRSSANLFAVTMMALAAYQGYRFIQTQNWAPEWIRKEAVQVDFQAYPHSEVQLRLRLDF